MPLQSATTQKKCNTVPYMSCTSWEDRAAASKVKLIKIGSMCKASPRISTSRGTLSQPYEVVVAIY